MRVTIGGRLVGSIILTIIFLAALAFYTIRVSQRFLQEAVGKLKTVPPDYYEMAQIFFG